MNVVFSRLALRRSREVQSYIAFDNISAAARVVHRIRQSTEMLADFPELGTRWDETTRALPVSGLPYRIHYRINASGQRIEIITIAHTSQLPPRFLAE